jgi:hypothetical protein
VGSRQVRNAFLKEGFDGTDARVGTEAPADTPFKEKVRQRKEAHPLVVRHVRLDDNTAFTVLAGLPTEIDRLIKTVDIEQSEVHQSLKFRTLSRGAIPSARRVA